MRSPPTAVRRDVDLDRVHHRRVHEHDAAGATHKLHGLHARDDVGERRRVPRVRVEAAVVLALEVLPERDSAWGEPGQIVVPA